ncbi:MAG: hypothetical protein ACLRPW_07205 [Intestinibacter sp.]
MNIRNLIDELAEKHILTKEELCLYYKNINDEDRKYLMKSSVLGQIMVKEFI